MRRHVCIEQISVRSSLSPHRRLRLRARPSNIAVPGTGRVEARPTLPTAPSPVTTHYQSWKRDTIVSKPRPPSTDWEPTSSGDARDDEPSDSEPRAEPWLRQKRIAGTVSGENLRQSALCACCRTNPSGRPVARRKSIVDERTAATAEAIALKTALEIAAPKREASRLMMAKGWIPCFDPRVLLWGCWGSSSKNKGVAA